VVAAVERVGPGDVGAGDEVGSAGGGALLVTVVSAAEVLYQETVIGPIV
jgi:hypothetical protein